jgi:WD40 repeat protein
MKGSGVTDRTVRTYSFPELELQHVLGAHRSAVNAVSLSGSFIVSASGDRSIRLWDADTGKLLRTFENHHSRG